MNRTSFHLRVEGHAPVNVTRFYAVERINGLGRTDAISPQSYDTFGEPSLLGRTASLVVAGSAEGERQFHGMVTREEELSAGGLRLRIEPRLARLRHASAWRIFHGPDVLRVAEQLLGEHRVPFRKRISGSYPVRPHWTQRGESDLSFLRRVLAQEGIFFYIDHPRGHTVELDETSMGDGEVVVLCDGTQGYSAIVKERSFRSVGVPEQVQPGEERVLVGLSAARRVRTDRMKLVGRDFARPFTPHVSNSAGALAGAELPSDRTGFAYEHTADHEAAPPPADAARRLDARRADAATLRAKTSFPHALPGRIISLDAGMGPVSEHVVIEARHEGQPADPLSDLAYQVELALVPASVPVRPAVRQKKRVVGLETATVIGPAGKEIHTDEHGRVQVRFHWDLEGQPPEAWLRVSQAWAGPGYGTSWLPRVGAEVLVGYIGGDPDRPIVIGSLHHPASPSPVRCPQDAQDVGIRTRSTPGGAGASELIFSDVAGRERVSLRSARDLLVESVGNTAVRVSGDSEHLTAGSHTCDIGGSVALKIDGNRISTLGGHLHDAVAGSRTLRIGGDDNVTVSGASKGVYGAARFVEVAQSRHTFVGTAEQGGNEVVAVSRDVTVTAGRALELAAKDRMVLRCGDSSIVLMPDHIALQSKRIELYGRERTEFQHGDHRAVGFAYDGAFSLSADTITLASAAGASLVLDAEAKLDGALVKLNCGGASAGGAGSGIVGDDGEAVFRLGVAGTTPGPPYRFIIAAPDGERLERDIVPGGEIRLRGRPGERFVLVEVQRDGRKIATRKPSGQEA